MARLTMRHVPDPILRQQTRRITQIPASLKQYTDDMVETMHAEHGVGLAANQVGGLQKVAVIQLPEWNEPLVLINPEIIRREGEREVEEGCLSIPGYRGTVKRSERVRARALDLNGKVVRIKADGLLAQALEHETDHLNGVLYIDHLVSRESFWKITYEADPPEPTDDEPTDGEPNDGEATAEETQEPRASREESE
ncbi:MAG: peptide deformylase [Chloroflexota bacterium]|nr:peptide deformylase [Chloroflexota bacterium]